MSAIGALAEINFRLSHRVFMDDLFGNVFDNTVLEPVTPYKLAVYELIRTLNEVHQAPQYFTIRECNVVHALVHALLEKEHLDFVDLRRIVRFIDVEVRCGIYAGFVYATTCVKRGKDMVIRVDDLFCMTHRTGSLKNCLFSHANKISLWLRKLYAHWCRLSQQYKLDYLHKLRRYYASDEASLTNGFLLPLKFEIHSSEKARAWVHKQMHTIQVCPSKALSASTVAEYCSEIAKHHKDVHTVYLLEMINAIRQQDVQTAKNALRKFCDYSMYKQSGMDEIDSRQMCTIDQRPVRYGPLLLARLLRMFGEHDEALSLLTETVQQAQTMCDRTCLRMVKVELGAIHAAASSVYRKPMNNVPDPTTKEKKGESASTLTMESITKMIETMTNERDCMDEPVIGSETHAELELQKHLTEASLLLGSVASLRDGGFEEGFEGVNVTLSTANGSDDNVHSRIVIDAATAIVSSIRLQLGCWRAAASTAKVMKQTNTSDGIAPYYETEAYAIAGVNEVYACAAMGKWSEAIQLVTELKGRFLQEHNFLTANHVNICYHIIMADNHFRLRQYKRCAKQLKFLQPLAPEESVLRMALLLAQENSLPSAEKMLKEELEHVLGGTTLIYKLRLKMQLALILCRREEFRNALDLLQSVFESAELHAVPLIGAMASRRKALVMLFQDPTATEVVSQLYDNSEMVLLKQGTALEKALWYMGKAQVEIAKHNDPKDIFALAIFHAQKAGFPLIQKSVVHQVAVWMETYQIEERVEEIHEQFCHLDDHYPGTMDWTLI